MLHTGDTKLPAKKRKMSSEDTRRSCAPRTTLGAGVRDACCHCVPHAPSAELCSCCRALPQMALTTNSMMSFGLLHSSLMKTARAQVSEQEEAIYIAQCRNFATRCGCLRSSEQQGI